MAFVEMAFAEMSFAVIERLAGTVSSALGVPSVVTAPAKTASATQLQSTRPAGWALALLGCGLLLAPGAQAQNQPGPVVCTTSIEAPPAAAVSSGLGSAAPVEVTRCGPVQSTAQLVEQRFYSWRGPFERGVSLTNQITDFFGIAMGGPDGSKLMGFGFPDQTIVWDGAAINNLYNRMLDDQSPGMPIRTPDLGNPYRSSLVMAPYAPRPLDPVADPLTGNVTNVANPASGGTIRGLW